MRFSATALAFFALLGLPLAGLAEAADLDRAISASGVEVTPIDGFGVASVSRSYRGDGSGVLGDELASGAGGTASAREFALLNALEPVTAPDGIESIIGPDQRKRVTDTTKFPYRAVALVTFDLGRCSGFLIGPDTVVTAGHCVSPGDNTGFYAVRSYRVYPGRDGRSKPYGFCRAVDLYSLAGWVVRGRDDYDIGVIKLDCTIGNTTGWFGYYWVSGRNALKGVPVRVTGFPGDKALTMWQSKGRVTVSQARRTFYKNDTTGGVSGSPVYHRLRGCGWCVLAVHGYGVYNGPPYSNNNHGTRITRPVFGNLTAIRSVP